MLRRMKIKAAPNIFGGIKKPTNNLKSVKPSEENLETKNENVNENYSLNSDLSNICNSSTLIQSQEDDKSSTKDIFPSKLEENSNKVFDMKVEKITVSNNNFDSKKLTFPVDKLANSKSDTNSTHCLEHFANISKSSCSVKVFNDDNDTNCKTNLETKKVNFEINTKIDGKNATHEDDSGEFKKSKLEHDSYKKDVGVPKPQVNTSKILKNFTNRRTRIKGQPILPVSKRPVTCPLQQIDSKETSKDSFKILETINNNEPISQIPKEKTNLKSKEDSPVGNSYLSNKKGIESKENINNIDKLKNLEIYHQSNSPKDLRIECKKSKFIEKEEISTEKKLYIERKQKYRKKTSTGNLERSQMTMFDLIFWNPGENAMPGEQRSRSNSLNESITSENIEEEKAEESGLTIDSNVDHIVEAGKPSQMDLDIMQDDSEEEASALAPQVKIGPDGELIIDEKSLVIQTTAAKNRDEVLSRTEVVEEGNESSQYGKWSKRRKRSTEWTRKETARFYKALSTVGTDFSLMETIFAWRSRAELKIKFKKEERVNRHLIDTALNDCTQFDFSIFDESDYDPEEDRKESKEAEKAESKRKKRLERDQRRSIKLQEKKLKKEQEKMDKLRKKKLKNLYKKQKRKKAKKASKKIHCKTKVKKKTTLNVEPQEVICEVVFSAAEEDRVIENNFTKQENVDMEIEKTPKTNPKEKSLSSQLDKTNKMENIHQNSSQNDGLDTLSLPEVVDIREEDKVTFATTNHSIESSPQTLNEYEITHSNSLKTLAEVSSFHKELDSTASKNFQSEFPLSPHSQSSSGLVRGSVKSDPLALVHKDHSGVGPMNIKLEISRQYSSQNDNLDPLSLPEAVDKIEKKVTFATAEYSIKNTKKTLNENEITHSKFLKTLAKGSSFHKELDSTTFERTFLSESPSSHSQSFSGSVESDPLALAHETHSGERSMNIKSENFHDMKSSSSAYNIINLRHKENIIEERECNLKLNCGKTLEKPVNEENEAPCQSSTVQLVCPIANVKKSDDGQQFIEMNTRKGLQRIIVPPYGPQATNIVVMAASDPSNMNEYIYHVYTVAPIINNDPSKENLKSDSLQAVDPPSVMKIS